jgi:hypothetical protein
VWIGHYQGNPKEWFVVWAKDKEEAFLQIDAVVAEPDMTSLKEIHVPGFVNFTVEFEGKISPEYMRFSPPKEDVEAGYWLVFESLDAAKYIFKTISKKKRRR